MNNDAYSLSGFGRLIGLKKDVGKLNPAYPPCEALRLPFPKG